MSGLRGSIFELPEPSRTLHVRALWAEMAHDVASEFAEQYIHLDNWGYRLCLKSQAEPSPDGSLVRYRTIDVGIRRHPGKPTLLDVSVGNMFAGAASDPPVPLHIVDDLRYARWARLAGQVSLEEHASLVHRFTQDLMDAGWALEHARMTPFRILPPEVRNGRGIRVLPTEKFHVLAQYPASMPDPAVEMAVVWPGRVNAERAAAQATASLQRLLRSAGVQLPKVVPVPRIDPNAVNLVLLDDRADLANMPDLRSELRAAEESGVRFKLAKLSSLAQPYPAQNIVWDMFQIAGGKSWVPNKPQPAFCSLDAGHDRTAVRSRWVKVESDQRQEITAVKVLDTQLAEHIPAEQLDDLWPADPAAVLCRDGKLSQERSALERRAAAESRPVIEVKKSPKAMLWHASESDVRPAQFGDCVIDEHGELLLQTMPQNVRDYIHPIRLASQGDDAIALATLLLHQHSMPGLSLFRMSRLPGTLYFADLVSKLTVDGWPKVVGRGFRIPHVIP